MINQLHWLPLSARLEFKILVLVLKSKLSVAQKYLGDHICSTFSVTSHQLFSDWQAPFVPWVRTAMAQIRSFATIWPGPPYGMPSLPLFA